MKNNVRGGDLVARFGGEEFLMLLSDISLETAERIAQRIQRDLAKKNTVLPDGATLTISFGIAPVNNPSQLEQAADRLLYQAKKAGHDKVHVAGVVYTQRIVSAASRTRISIPALPTPN